MYSRPHTEIVAHLPLTSRGPGPLIASDLRFMHQRPEVAGITPDLGRGSLTAPEWTTICVRENPKVRPSRTDAVVNWPQFGATRRRGLGDRLHDTCACSSRKANPAKSGDAKPVPFLGIPSGSNGCRKEFRVRAPRGPTIALASLALSSLSASRLDPARAPRAQARLSVATVLYIWR